MLLILAAIIFDVSATQASENDDFVIITVTPRAPIPGPVAVPVLVETVNGQALGMKCFIIYNIARLVYTSMIFFGVF